MALEMRSNPVNCHALFCSVLFLFPTLLVCLTLQKEIGSQDQLQNSTLVTLISLLATFGFYFVLGKAIL